MSLLTTGSPRQIDESVLREYFERLDPLVKSGTELFVIGGAAVALLGAKIGENLANLETDSSMWRLER
jgi:hypothetical protein